MDNLIENQLEIIFDFPFLKFQIPYKLILIKLPLSVIWAKSLTYGAYISSNFDATKRELTPSNCNYFLSICNLFKHLSIKFIVMNNVSFLNLNLFATSDNQSIKIDLI